MRPVLRVTGTVLVIAVAFVTPVLATATATPASADTVVNGCTIVANPTPTNFTNCPGADLQGPTCRASTSHSPTWLPLSSPAIASLRTRSPPSWCNAKARVSAGRT